MEGVRSALLAVGGTIAIVGLVVAAFAFVEAHRPVSTPPECQTIACPAHGFDWSPFYQFGIAWLVTGFVILLSAGLVQPARRVTPLEGKLLLERIEGPLRKSD